jgi:hypothetical protein
VYAVGQEVAWARRTSAATEPGIAADAVAPQLGGLQLVAENHIEPGGLSRRGCDKQLLRP